MFRRTLHREHQTLGMVSFSWRVKSLVEGADVRENDLEDAPVRVMLAFDGDHTRLSARTRLMFDLVHTLSGEPPPFATLMYVWTTSRASILWWSIGAATGCARSFSSRGRRTWGNGAATGATFVPTIAAPLERTPAR